MDKDRELDKKIKTALGLERKAVALGDIQRKVKWIQDNVFPANARVEQINDEIARMWVAHESWTPPLDDAAFVAQVLDPALRTYGAGPEGAYTLEELESDTGRRRRQ